MKFNIVIPTRNPKKGSNNFEFILNSNIALNKLIIIDDSTNKSSSKMLEELSLKYKPKIILLNKNILKKINVPFKLGSYNWNLGNARSLGMMTSLAYSECSEATIFFDDDIYPTKQTIKIEKNCMRKHYLGKINIQGSPDLSRLEWIELYLKVRSPNSKVENIHINRIYYSCKKKSKNLIEKYTDLLPELNEDKITVPQRNELSGGAFLCDNKLLKFMLFSNWFDEDWLWFESCRKTQDAKMINLRFKVFHNSKIKQILIKKKLLFEENGKIMTTLLKNNQPINQKNELEDIIDQRVRLINKILQHFLKINNKNYSDKKIIKELEKLSIELKNINRTTILKKINNFKGINELYLKNKKVYLKNLKKFLK
ncbi:hypothetical protein COV11_02240 [Candidatus Woesearchaeota archaeon CG10_big_fil_rev_8_21_14_0_10_30_7]|nr:MAG: hypothetical protein COV11_02240 [Candidatus Woesearchaeota archaeon CG10_big_fil_rev_8_21_14_0_10_30_7]